MPPNSQGCAPKATTLRMPSQTPKRRSPFTLRASGKKAAQRGSHVRLKKAGYRNPLVVPLHKELRKGTLGCAARKPRAPVVRRANAGLRSGLALAPDNGKGPSNPGRIE